MVCHGLCLLSVCLSVCTSFCVCKRGGVGGWVGGGRLTIRCSFTKAGRVLLSPYVFLCGRYNDTEAHSVVSLLIHVLEIFGEGSAGVKSFVRVHGQE